MKLQILSLAILIPAVTILSLGACSDANRAAISNLGNPGLVKKFSGGKLIYAGISTGKIENKDHSDGYYFNDRCEHNTLVEVTGDTLVITRPEFFPTCEELKAEIKAEMSH